MIIGRKFRENIWNVDLVLKYFHEELVIKKKVIKKASFSHKSYQIRKKAIKISQTAKEILKTAIFLKRFLIMKHATKINSKNVSIFIRSITLNDIVKL